MRIKDTGIFQIYRKCFSSDQLRIWRSQMENSYKGYLKKGLTSEKSLSNLETQYVLILMDLAVKHPQLFKTREIHQTVVSWMNRPDSVIPVAPNNNEAQGE